MKTQPGYVVVLVTAPDMKVARRLARIALRARLVACANLVPRVESHYWWQGKIESSRETFLVLKTRRERLKQLERALMAAHPYDTPEFIAMSVAGGSPRYLAWVSDSVAG